MADKQANDKLPGASPISGLPPPEEHRWKPGQSGNPKGRPKGRSITAVLRDMLDDDAVDTQGKKQKVKRAVAGALLRRALGGDVKAIREVLDRTEGRVKEQHEVSGPGGRPVQLSTTDLINMANNGGFQVEEGDSDEASEGVDSNKEAGDE